MKSRIFATLAVASMIGLSGCASMSDRQTAGTVGGAVLGGVAGSALTKGSTLGTLGGAAAGGYIANRATDPRR